ncbi:transglycosylase SLT domain-containing protein [Acinetobacter sp.]|uniref:transglycosylase SLT domain-containing protein n=1 Tax=Acinetobacter sp. TaxID=472 RepID=UPI002FD87F51
MRVPVLNKQVEEAQTPNVQVRGGLTPGEAVGIVGNQLDGITGLAGAGAQVVNQFNDESDRVRVMDAENQLAALRNHLQTNNVDGFGNKKGADVVGFDDGQGGGFVDYYSRAYQDGVGEIAAKLGNNRQRQMFNQVASRDGINFKNNLQSYFVNQNDNYQKSVYSASADRYVQNINNNPADFKLIDEDRLNLKAAINKSAQLDGKSALEAENIYLGVVSQAHANNINSFIENHDLRGAVQYRDKYQNEISMNDSFKANKWIQQKLEERQVDALVNFASAGTEENSNFALNLPPQATQQAVSELQNLTPDQMKNIKYNDQRLDIYTVQAAKDKGMDWAVPLLLGIRLSGEKSNNNEISPKGAKSIMQFMPATWGEYSKNGQRDINNPAHTIDAALEFIDWISKKYNTKDPMVISAYYNGGGNAAVAVKNGKQAPYSETRAYLERMDDWLTNGFGKYASKPGRTRQEAFNIIDNIDAPLAIKEKAQSSIERRFAAQDKAKKETQNTVYDSLYKVIASGQSSYEQIPVNAFNILTPDQIKGLKSVSKATFNPKKESDGVTLAALMIDKDLLLKGQPRSVLHQFAKDLTVGELKEAVKLYDDVNKKPSDVKKDDVIEVSPKTVSDYLNPYLPMLGITNKSNKKQIEHYSAVQSDITQTLREAEARKGGKLTKDEFGRLVIKTIGLNSKITTTRNFLGVPLTGNSERTLNRVYSVKSKDDIADNTQKKIDDLFKKQGRDLSKVTLSEYLNAYYSMMRRGF